MNIRHFKPVAAAAVLAASLGALPAQAEGLYVGASLGTPHFDSGANGINGVVGNGSGLSGKVFGGYQMNQNFTVELGLADLGHINDGSGTVRSRAEYVDAVGLLPLGSGWSLLGSAGVDHVNFNTSNGDGAGFGLKLGLGAEYALSRTVSLRGEWEHYQAATFSAHPTVGQYTIGVRAGF